MNLLGTSITALQKLINDKEVSSQEVSDYFRKRIEKYNPELNAFVTPFDGILRYTQDDNTVLAGIPIAVKDNFNVKGTRTTASSKVLDDYISPYESTVTDRLNKAGAVFTGKTNMDAWAHGASTETSDYGATKNPWDTSRAPGGSSGGSGAAVAAYLSPAAIGTDTGGSIRCPAAWCGIIGLKPTYGRVSRYGVIAMGSSLDSPGPMSWHSEDSAKILEVIAGRDPYDATSSQETVEEYSKTMKEKRQLTIGVPESFFEGVQDDVKSKVDEAVRILEKLGHKVKKIELLSPEYALSVYTIVQRAEVSSNLGRYDAIRFGNGRDQFGPEAKRRIMLGTYTLSHGYYDAYYKTAQKVRALIRQNFEDTFKDVDAVITPTTPLTATKIGDFDKYPFFGELMDKLNEPASVAGIPSISIPVGLDSSGLPVGMQIMGNYFAESTILNLAYQFEQETNFFDMRETLLKKYPD